jgi:hypothetical protein
MIDGIQGHLDNHAPEGTSDGDQFALKFLEE